MSRPAIVVENLSKRYQIGLREKSRETFREALTGLATAPFRRFRKLAGQVPEEEAFWALKDVSFEVQPGEVVGIIGRNGAGKSTLLKILSQITEPTTGHAIIRGRVGSLLEVGTGFHQELTGRENVYLNGSILGMSKREIDRKFNEIVDFAGVEKFIDTPVKRYSSGMKVRLGFAVAAHLEPEILIVDEVLAVGDFEFQRRCLGKMNDVAESGRTVLFVSHNMAAVESLCSSGILLEAGEAAIRSDVASVMHKYLSHQSAATSTNRQNTIQRVTVLNQQLQETSIVPSGGTFIIQCAGHTKSIINQAVISIRLFDTMGHRVTSVLSPTHSKIKPTIAGAFTFDALFSDFRLTSGLYTMEVHFGDGNTTLEVQRGPDIQVEHSALSGTIHPVPAKSGVYLSKVDCKWTGFNNTNTPTIANTIQ